MISIHFQILHLFFFFNDTATTEIYTLSLHDALPISHTARITKDFLAESTIQVLAHPPYSPDLDRKSTRLNSSHSQISYAVFCLKKKNTNSPLPSSYTQFATTCSSSFPDAIITLPSHC